MAWAINLCLLVTIAHGAPLQVWLRDVTNDLQISCNNYVSLGNSSSSSAVENLVDLWVFLTGRNRQPFCTLMEVGCWTWYKIGESDPSVLCVCYYCWCCQGWCNVRELHLCTGSVWLLGASTTPASFFIWGGCSSLCPCICSFYSFFEP
jgi:hypothetical protein